MTNLTQKIIKAIKNDKKEFWKDHYAIRFDEFKPVEGSELGCSIDTTDDEGIKLSGTSCLTLCDVCSDLSDECNLSDLIKNIEFSLSNPYAYSYCSLVVGGFTAENCNDDNEIVLKYCTVVKNIF